jgi:nucleoside-diphosphate-sugar epimerase
MPVILVTGATGFVGRHVVDRLAQHREILSVRALVRQRASGHDQVPGNVEIVTGDLLDLPSVERAVNGVDAIVHLASKNVDHDGTGFKSINVDGTRALCEAAVGHRVSRLIYLSSVGVYGHGIHRGSDESTPVRPDTDFSRSKAAAEQLILDHHKAGDFQACVLRQRFVYGEGDRFLIPRMVKAVRRTPFWIGGGRAKLSVILVNDLAEIMGSLATQPEKTIPTENPVYHVTDGTPVSYRELVSTVCRSLGYPLPRLSLPFWPLYGTMRFYEKLRRIDPESSPLPISSIRIGLVGQDNYFSNEKIRDLLPGLQFQRFTDGLQQSLDYYREVISE